MNIKQTTAALKAAGFELRKTKYDGFVARKRAANGEGGFLWLRFDKRTKEGRRLKHVDLSAFPLLDGRRRILNGAKGRELKEAKALSSLLPCTVKTCGCTLETFISGKRQPKKGKE